MPLLAAAFQAIVFLPPIAGWHLFYTCDRPGMGAT
jgi:hypothetical protein